MKTLQVIMPTLSLTEFQRRVEGLDKLPSLPAVLLPALNQLSADSDDVDLNKTVQLISHDSVLSSQVLHIANSPSFGARQRITSLRTAILALGISRLREIVSSCSLMQISPIGRAFDPMYFWEHSLVCRNLARKINYADLERAYLAGLVHDLGILVNVLLISHEFTQVFEIAVDSRRPLLDVEREQIGMTHEITGDLLSSHWHLCDYLSEVMRHHHDVGNATRDPVLTSLVNVAVLLCRTSGREHGYEESLEVRLLEEPAWKVLAVHSPGLNSLGMACFATEIESYVQEVRTLVLVLFRF